MNIQELATLAEQNLDVTVIVLDNGTLGMVRQQQEFLFNKNYSASIYRKNPDLTLIATGFGIAASDIEQDSRWAETAFPREPGAGPRFIRVPIAMEENVYPFVPAGKPNIEAMEREIAEFPFACVKFKINNQHEHLISLPSLPELWRSGSCDDRTCQQVYEGRTSCYDSVF